MYSLFGNIHNIFCFSTIHGLPAILLVQGTKTWVRKWCYIGDHILCLTKWCVRRALPSSTRTNTLCVTCMATMSPSYIVCPVKAAKKASCAFSGASPALIWFHIHLKTRTRAPRPIWSACAVLLAERIGWIRSGIVLHLRRASNSASVPCCTRNITKSKINWNKLDIIFLTRAITTPFLWSALSWKRYTLTSEVPRQAHLQ